jgi:hypothetical protein
VTNQQLIKVMIALAGQVHETQVKTGMKPPDWLTALANGNPDRGESVIEFVSDKIDVEVKHE